MNKKNADFKLGDAANISIKYGIAPKVKKTAIVSIMKVLPQKRYNGLDQSNAQNTQATCVSNFNFLVIKIAGQAQAKRKKQLIRRPVWSIGKWKMYTIKATMLDRKSVV
jgi:hypothetical protein